MQTFLQNESLFTSMVQKLTPSSFINLCQTNKAIFQLIRRKNKTIGIFLRNYELSLICPENSGSKNQMIEIEMKKTGDFPTVMRSYEIRLDEMSQTMKNLSFFTFGAIFLSAHNQHNFINFLANEKMRCEKVNVKGNHLLGDSVQKLKPKHLIVRDCGKNDPIELFNRNRPLLMGLESCSITVDQKDAESVTQKVSLNFSTFNLKASGRVENDSRLHSIVKEVLCLSYETQSGNIPTTNFKLETNVSISADSNLTLQPFYVKNYHIFPKTAGDLQYFFIFPPFDEFKQDLAFYVELWPLSDEEQQLTISFSTISNCLDLNAFIESLVFTDNSEDQNMELINFAKKRYNFQ